MSQFLYLLPCAYEDLVKLGISNDPLSRLRAFSPRWFEFFDLDHALLLEGETRREVQAWETALKRELKLLNAPAPLLVPEAAAGHTEWFRGGQADISERMRAWAVGGFRLHDPARTWLRDRVEAGSDRLFAWSEAAWLSADALGDAPVALALRQTVRDACDEQVAMGLDLQSRVPEAVWAWHRGGPPDKL